MKYIYLFNFITFIIIFKSVQAAKKGKESSLLYLSNSNEFNYDRISNIIVFGDSFTSTNTDFNTMEYTGKNSSGGKNWPLHLIDLHEMTLWNFAIGGAVIDTKILPRMSLIYQYKLFNENMGKGGKFSNRWNSKNTMIAIWLGSNDVRFSTPITPSNILYTSIVRIMFIYIEKMYKLGVKNFLILNIPPLHKAPLNKSGEFDYYETCVGNFNDLLIAHSSHMMKQHKDVNVILYNTNEEYEYVMDNYQEFNLKNSRDKWNSFNNTNLNDFFWRDRSHLTPMGNKILADDINDLLVSINK